MARVAPVVILDCQIREILERLRRSRTLPQHFAERVRIVLMSADGLLCSTQAEQLGVDAQRVRRWRTRWVRRADRLAKAVAKGATSVELEKLALEIIADDYRSGVRPKFSAEQVAAIIALACEDPGAHGLPVSHWTPTELATKAKERGIVENISSRQVGRFLKGGTATAAYVSVLAQRQTGRPRDVSTPGRGGLRHVSRSAGA